LSAGGPPDRSPEGSSAPPLPAGRIGRPHGLDGSFYVTRPRPRLLLEGTSVTVDGQPRRVIRRAGTDGRPILRLEGISSREAVEALRSADLWIEGADAPVLEEGEWWAHELEGCEVFDAQLAVGRVVSMLELPSCEALVVDRGDAGELIVPMVKAAIRSIDPRARRVEVDLGFLGVDTGGGEA
jgi:16S rRNA processing protein RimM